MEPLATPFYTDWTFWSFVVAGIALIGSQLPPVVQWRAKRKLDLEVFSHIFITHYVGNANAQMHVLLTNSGNRSLRVNSIELHIVRTDANPRESFTLPGKNYLQLPSDKTNIILTSFLLKPGEDWGHIVNFLNFFTRQGEIRFRQLRSALKSEIFRLRALREPEDQADVAVAPAFYDPLVVFFNENFIWRAGDYEVMIRVKTTHEGIECSKRFQFTLFESDERELRSYTDDYKFGAGVYFNSDNHSGVFVQLRPV